MLQHSKQHGGDREQGCAALTTDDLQGGERMKGQQGMHDRASSEWTQHPDDTTCGVKEGHEITIAILGAEPPLTRNDHRIIENAPMPQDRSFGEARRPRRVLNLGRVLWPDLRLPRTQRIGTDLYTSRDQLLKEGRLPPLLLEHALRGRTE